MAVSIALNIVAVHLSLETIARGPVVQVASRGAVAYIPIAARRVAISGGGGVGGICGVRSMARVRKRGVGSSNVGISVVVAVSVARVVRGVAVRGIAVRGVAVRGVRSVGRGAAINVGGGGDHGVTGSSAHVHLLANAPLVLVSGTSVAVSVSGRRVAISIGGV